MSLFSNKPPVSKPPEPTPASRPAPAQPASQAVAPARQTMCVIGPKTSIKGEISGDEDVMIEGTIEGQIKIARDLRVGQGGCVKATVEAHSIVIAGEVIGDCVVTNRVEIQASGRLTGNIRAPKIVIAEGAMFRGNSEMSGRRD